MLDAVKDVLVFNGTDLLERFLTYVTDVAKQSKGDQPPHTDSDLWHTDSDLWAWTCRNIRDYYKRKWTVQGLSDPSNSKIPGSNGTMESESKCESPDNGVFWRRLVPDHFFEYHGYGRRGRGK